jgi:hypothetical protein
MHVKNPQIDDLDPDALYDRLLKEAQEDNVPEAEKTASAATTNDVVMDKTFFDKVASGDEAATKALDGFIDSALAAGSTPDQVTDLIAQMENEANGVTDPPAATTTTTTTTTTTEQPAATTAQATTEEPPKNDDAPTDEDDFELQKAAIALEFAEKGIDAELEKNPLAKSAGITRESLAAEILGEVAGIAYHQARQETADRIAKIASAYKPTPEQVQSKIAELKGLGFDVAPLEAQLASMGKTAGEAKPAPTPAPVAPGTEKLAQDPKVAAALAVLDRAGIDTTKLAEKDNKGSTAKGVAAGVAATAGGMAAHQAVKNRGGYGAVASQVAEKARSMVGKARRLA